MAVDFTNEALRLLDEEPETSENADRLKDDKAQALLWLYICTLEKNLQEVIDLCYFIFFFGITRIGVMDGSQLVSTPLLFFTTRNVGSVVSMLCQTDFCLLYNTFKALKEQLFNVGPFLIV